MGKVKNKIVKKRKKSDKKIRRGLVPERGKKKKKSLDEKKKLLNEKFIHLYTSYVVGPGTYFRLLWFGWVNIKPIMYDRIFDCLVSHQKVFHESIEEELLYESNKRIHKRTFYRDLYDDLMPVAWHPDRFLDWCVDIEELKVLEELWVS